jgi:Histidine kinase-, DNA gyrase B-, and HSP90-like ATPase
MKVSVQVQNDHLERISRVRKPVLAIAELIWNGLDADAHEVRVEFERNGLGGLERIRVTDNGYGLPHSEAQTAFGNLGGSHKRGAHRSKLKRRLLHGKAGKGRFRAFALGSFVRWNTTFAQNGNKAAYAITGSRVDLGTFEISDPQSKSANTGTIVTIEGIDKNFPSLRGAEAIQEITQHFALYLREYPDVAIWYDGQRIDPSAVEELVTDYSLESIETADGKTVTADLTVIEWTIQTERSLFLCDQDGFALAEMPPGIQAPGFDFTAYLKSGFLRELDEQDALVLEELQPDLRKLLEASKETLRDHFRKRTAERAVDLVEVWKKEKVYPFEGEPQNIIEESERQVFDVLALNLNAYLPYFEQADTKNKRLALQLLKQALEKDPTALQKILQDVLELPLEKQEEFAELLTKTSLTAIINASKIVADRLDFLRGLELLVFDEESRERLLERSQLHRILADRTWVFGEQFNLTVDDQSLTEVLRKHLHILGRATDSVAPVVPEDAKTAIVDLMLSRRIPQPHADEREHLVIELKRPSQDVDADVATQIKKYAFAVADDERFKDTKTRWIFWAVSNQIADGVQKEAKQRNRPQGLLYDDDEGRITVWVRTWGQIIQDCRGRLEFFREQLEYSADRDSALAYLRKTHEKYLPKNLSWTEQTASRVK